MNRTYHLLAALLPIGLLLLCSGRIGRADTACLALPPEFDLWQSSLTLRQELGYCDNVTRSSDRPLGSAFETVSGEAIGLRLPWNDWQLNLYAAGSDTRYLGREVGGQEQQDGTATAQFSWFPHNDVRTLSAVEYTYVNQRTDVSATYDTVDWQQVEGHGLTVKQGLRADVSAWFAELTFAGSRYFYRAPMDDYWQFGPALSAGRYYGYTSELSFHGATVPLRYATREQVGPDGAILPDTSLGLRTHSVGLVWRHGWDEENRWQTSLLADFERSTDNGSGYFDYRQYRLSAQLRYAPPGWAFSARLGTSYWDFDRQRIAPTDPETRQRVTVASNLRAQRTLSRHWSLFVSYICERSFSNFPPDRHVSHTGSGGVEYVF